MDLATELLHELKSTSKRWFILFIIMLILLFATNISWIIAWKCLNTTSKTITVDAVSGNANYIGANGDIVNYTK